MTFYITTPIYYVNDTPHIGHAYTTVIADTLTRFHRLFGEESFFLTGTDEHGQKVQSAAKSRQLDPQTHVDELVLQFQDIWKTLNIEPDFFIRTTMPFHKKVVQDCLQNLFEKGEIYTGEYEGWYSVSEEIFYTEDELVDGKSPIGKDVVKIKEKNYFFKMSAYQDRLIKHIEANPTFIQPDGKRSEVLGFLKKPLGDLCISRTKSRLNWGVEIPFDNDYVTYVWFDALLNYASGIGYRQAGKEDIFKKWWENCVHLIGKDILITHSVYWPTMLMALDVPLPKQIFAHGWWLTEGDKKMSKSEGPVVKPLDMKDIIGVDALRYFLVRDRNPGNDGLFSKDLVLTRVNSELANNFGNLLSRSLTLIGKFFEGKTPPLTENDPLTKELRITAEKLADEVKDSVNNLEANEAIGKVVELLTQTNRYVDKIEPWKTGKTDPAKAGECLRSVLEVLRISAILLSPVMPTKCFELLCRIGYNSKPTFIEAKMWGLLKTGTVVTAGEPLFPRV